jgi:hypothetical protein
LLKKRQKASSSESWKSRKVKKIKLSDKYPLDEAPLKDLLRSIGGCVSSIRLQDALGYHSNSFNVIPIPKPGQLVAEVLSNDGQSSTIKADGKSAKGYG